MMMMMMPPSAVHYPQTLLPRKKNSRRSSCQILFSYTTQVAPSAWKISKKARHSPVDTIAGMSFTATAWMDGGNQRVHTAVGIYTGHR